MKRKKAKKIIGENNKLTNSRLLILELIKKSKKALNPYEIEKNLKSKINVTTIYRNLKLFEKMGIVHKIRSVDGYIACNTNKNKHCHHYIVCRNCNIVEEIKEKNHTHKTPKKFSNSENIFEAQGICKKCKTK